ncbi:MAG: TfoX/Sxy family protein [Calditrichae bacterium]|nr:TfoX/Sxy family protein [Calditrichia bacterium]
MTSKQEFLEYILELIQPLGNVSSKAMFGGYGLFKDSLMFALLIDDILYFKSDAFNRFEFERLHLDAFTYIKKGKPITTSYHKAPEEALDNPEEMLRWAKLGYEAAFRKKNN